MSINVNNFSKFKSYSYDSMVNNTPILPQQTSSVRKEDTVSFSNKELSIRHKQNIIHYARTNTLTFGTLLLSVFAPLRYLLKSDISYAKEYNLDAKKDKNFIDRIRKEQVKTTLPLVATELIALPTLFYSAILYCSTACIDLAVFNILKTIVENEDRSKIKV